MRSGAIGICGNLSNFLPRVEDRPPGILIGPHLGEILSLRKAFVFWRRFGAEWLPK
jgi:hypothetical protein